MRRRAQLGSPPGATSEESCQLHHWVLHRHRLTPKDADPDVAPIKTNANSRFTAGEGWHTDVSCDETPISTSLLYVTQVPENGGGDTLFANKNHAYETLSPPVKSLVANLAAVHDGTLPWKAGYGIDPNPGTQYPVHVHPIVIAHPETGLPILWVNRGFTTRIRGVSERESRYLLKMLFNHIEASPVFSAKIGVDVAEAGPHCARKTAPPHQFAP